MENVDNMLALYIDVVDISEYQLENIYLKVQEEENNLFSFYCKSFEFEEVHCS